MDKTKTKAEPDIPATMIESGIADAMKSFSTQSAHFGHYVRSSRVV
jgi:hypothetical protein